MGLDGGTEFIERGGLAELTCEVRPDKVGLGDIGNGVPEQESKVGGDVFRCCVTEEGVLGGEESGPIWGGGARTSVPLAEVLGDGVVDFSVVGEDAGVWGVEGFQGEHVYLLL